jgi:hypothetical protein
VNNWPRLMLMSAATSAWLIYDMATATEPPSQAAAVLQYVLLACGLIGFVSSALMIASQE